MSEHPIRLVVGDDLVRDRLTVFFRWLLAIPHFIWLGLWGIAVFFAAIANWLATLLLGRSPSSLHNFLAAYVKYVTKFYAYLYLAADPYPSFDGRTAYPVEVTIDGAERQNRWRVAFRGILFLPSALLLTALVGAPGGTSKFARGGTYTTGLGLLHVAAILGWFAIMARGRMPRGLRDAVAYALSYGAQSWAYALLLTDRYPDSDPLTAVPELPVRADPIHLRVVDDELRRSRLTVFFRLLLAFPHLIWLALWGMLALLAAILSWFATLFAGRSPAWAHSFLSAYLRYQFHVYAFLYLIANPFPGFVGRAGSYPLEIAVAERRRQNRWKTGFRLILVLPALLLASAYGGLAAFVALLGWFASLARARMPRGLRNAGALALRYHAQTLGYALLLSDSYPYSGPMRGGTAEGEAGLVPDSGPAPEQQRPLASTADAPPPGGALPDVGLG